MRRTALGAMMAMTMGCAAIPPSEPGEAPVPVHGETGRRCNAAPAQNLVGRAASSALGAEAMRLSGAGAIRWIPPGAAVTMDYREDRLNIELDGRNRVTRLRCG
jgi:hypothetical protein